MSMESSQSQGPKNRPEDFETAQGLINEHSLLPEDEKTKYVMEHEGMTPDGVEVDLIRYLSARAAVLDMNAAKEKLTEIEKIDPASVLVASSESWKTEGK
jgi:hypothetical protein